MPFGDDPTASQPAVPPTAVPPTAAPPTAAPPTAAPTPTGPPVAPPPVPPGYPTTPPPFRPSAGSPGGSPPPIPPTNPMASASPPPARGGRARRTPRIVAVVVALLVAGFVFGLGSGALFTRVSNPSGVSTAEPYPTVPTPPAGRSTPSTTLPDRGTSDPFGGSTPSGPSSRPGQSDPYDAAPSSPSGGTTSGNGLSSDDVAAVAAKVNPGVVDINTVTGHGQGAGTGMVLNSSGRVLTNNHVISGATEIVATDVDTGKRYKAKVVGTDPSEDVAVIQLDGASGLDAIDTGDSAAVAVGDPIVAIGNAGGRGGTPSAVTGQVVATGQEITVSDEMGVDSEHLTGLIQVDAPIQPGDSGGPLANSDGKVVGINTAASADSVRGLANGEGYAVPINAALRIAKQIEAGQESATVHIGGRGVLGVNVDPTATTAPGAAVVDVSAGSGAAKAGVAAGSVIISLDGRSIRSADELTTAMTGHKTGDRVELGWTDATGADHTATVTLTEGPPD